MLMTTYKKKVFNLSSADFFLSFFTPGVDEQLSKHIAHLWIRDPLVVFSNKIKLDDEADYSHFEVFHSYL